MSSLLEIKSAYNDTMFILELMKLAKCSVADFEAVRCCILYGEVIIPKRYCGMIMKLFKKPPVKANLIGEEFNEWLKKFLHTQLSIDLPTPNPTQANYYELFTFLEQGKNELYNLKNTLLNAQCFMSII